MTKKYILILNWKMNLGIQESKDLADEIREKICKKLTPKISDLVICPSFPAIQQVKDVLGNCSIQLGAQDVFWAENGAYTGEVSISALKELGVKYVILGHSERRQYLNETSDIINKKVKAVLDRDLIPVICVGETFEERREGLKDAVVTNQVTGALKDVVIKSEKKIIIAYEPVWMIGSGQAVSPEEVEHTHMVIRQALFDTAYENRWPDNDNVVRKNIKLIYGGSVDENNIKDFISKDMINGVLVGGASLRVNEIFSLIKAIKPV